MTVNQAASAIAYTRLSSLLLRWILLVALGISTFMSLVQIVHSVGDTQQAIDREGRQILALFEDPARQALYNLDSGMGGQVMSRLFRHDAMRSARLGHPDELPLAEKLRPLQHGSMRFLTDRLFAPVQSFSLPLSDLSGEHVLGRLDISLDTAGYAAGFIKEALIILGIGMLRVALLGIVLYLLLGRLLNRPLSVMLSELSYIDPEHPGVHQLSIAPGHRNNELGQWITRINQLLHAIQRVSQLRREAEESLLHMSHVDFLTGLPNRLGLQGKLDKVLIAARKNDTSVAVMCIGLDGFKSINERHSFQLGDWVLRSFAQRVSSQLQGEGASFARLGGDQFILIQSGLNNYQAAVQAQKVLFLLHQPFVVPQQGRDDVTIRLTATIGITLFPDDAPTGELLLQKAEQTMRLSKMGGRNRYQFYIASIDQQLRERRQLEDDLRVAIEHEELHLLYQPQIDYSSGKIVGAEALLRWRRKGAGLVPPDTFIPLAEQSGIIIEIGNWVLEQACKQVREWLDIGWADFRVAVNLSAIQLHNEELLPTIERMLSSYRIPPACLEFEVTETCLMQDVDKARQQLLALRKLGVAIAIDDFGTGHSSLAYLKRLPLDKIKIDRSFVQDVLDDDDDATIVRTIIQLSHSLQFKVLAEGVETEAHERTLIAMGCDEGQGYLYSRPISADEVLDKYGRFGD